MLYKAKQVTLAASGQWWHKSKDGSWWQLLISIELYTGALTTGCRKYSPRRSGWHGWTGWWHIVKGVGWPLVCAWHPSIGKVTFDLRRMKIVRTAYSQWMLDNKPSDLFRALQTYGTKQMYEPMVNLLDQADGSEADGSEADTNADDMLDWCCVTVDNDEETYTWVS
jgi:hypothetical protein